MLESHLALPARPQRANLATEALLRPRYSGGGARRRGFFYVQWCRVVRGLTSSPPAASDPLEGAEAETPCH